MKYLSLVAATVLAACATSPTTSPFSVVGESQVLCTDENDAFGPMLVCTWVKVMIAIDGTENSDMDLINIYFEQANKLLDAVNDKKIDDDQARALLVMAYRQINVMANKRNRQPGALSKIGHIFSSTAAGAKASRQTVFPPQPTTPARTECRPTNYGMECFTY